MILGQNEINTDKESGRDEDISVWARNQIELIRRKQLDFNELQKKETELDKGFWVNLALDGVVIVAGSFLLFVPKIRPAVIPLIAGRRITLTGKRLGALLIGVGGLESSLDIWSYVFGSEERIPSFISDIAFKDVLTQELFSILSSAGPSYRYLAIELLKSAANETTLISGLLNAIQNEQYPLEVRQPAIRALRAVSNMDEDSKTEVIRVLIGLIDGSHIPSLRETALYVLGELGEGRDEVVVYLEKMGDNVNESDELRLIALINLGRNENHFFSSIQVLAAGLFENRQYIKSPFRSQPEFSDSFLNSLLLVKRRELSDSHIIVVREFIRLGILNAELKIRFSEALMSWDDSPKTKELLKEAYSNPVEDIRLYVENNLFKNGVSEENYRVFEFLTTNLSLLEGITTNLTNILQQMESIIENIEPLSPNQIKIKEKLRGIVNSYKKILKAIQN